MKLTRLGIKIFLEEPVRIELRSLIPIFHKWIQRQAIDKHMLIDVHDYSHIFRGPGILLVGHEGNFSLDLAENRLGLLYQRKQPMVGSPESQFGFALASLLRGCFLLENEQLPRVSLRFRTNEFRVSISDRLNSPSNERTFKRFEPLISKFFQQCFNEENLNCVYRGCSEEPFAVDVKTSSLKVASELLERLTVNT